MNSYVFLQEYKDALLKNWLSVLRQGSMPSFLLFSDEMQTICGNLLDKLTNALHPDTSQPFSLIDWALFYRREHQVPLAELIQLISGLRRALEQTPPATTAISLLQQVNPLLDRAIWEMADAFNQVSQETMNQRMEEIEKITYELANTSEETDRALIQLKSLYDISRQLSASLNIIEILQKTLSELTAITYAHSGVAWIPHHESLQPDIVLGLDAELLDNFALEESGIGRALQIKDIVVISEKSSIDPVDKRLLQLLQSVILLAIPLFDQNDVVGVLTLHSSDERLIADINLIRAVVQQATIALQNAQLYEEVHDLNRTLEKRVTDRTHDLVVEKERLETMYQITTQLTTTLDANQLVKLTLQQLATAVGAQEGVVLLNEDSFSMDMTYRASLNGDCPIGQSPSVIHNLIGRRVMRYRKPIMIEDFMRDEEWMMVIQKNHITLEQMTDRICSVVAVPIKADRDLHGVLLLTHTQPNRFTIDQMRLLEAVATQLAVAINNANLHEYVKEQVIHLGEILHEQEIEAGQKQAILASISDGVIASNAEGNIMLINPAAEHILGVDGSSFMGQPLQQLVAGLNAFNQKELSKALASLQKSKTHQAMREIILGIDEQIINARLTLALTPKQKQVGTVTVLRDTTKEVEADRVKSEFVATVSHELRTPMTSIMGYVYLMQQGVSGDSLAPQQKDFLNIIKDNAERLACLINDLLDISRIEAGKIELNLEELHLEEIVENVFNLMLVPAQNKGLALQIMPTPPDLPLIYADRNRIIQVLTNLVGNAISYTEEGTVTIGLEAVAGMVKVCVQDTGIGISSDDLPRIFNRFYRAEHDVVQASSGTGLGLAITQSFVEMHNGRIWVESQEKQGSTFSFVLPSRPKTSEAVTRRKTAC